MPDTPGIGRTFCLSTTVSSHAAKFTVIFAPFNEWCGGKSVSINFIIKFFEDFSLVSGFYRDFNLYRSISQGVNCTGKKVFVAKLCRSRRLLTDYFGTFVSLRQRIRE